MYNVLKLISLCVVCFVKLLQIDVEELFLQFFHTLRVVLGQFVSAVGSRVAVAIAIGIAIAIVIAVGVAVRGAFRVAVRVAVASPGFICFGSGIFFFLFTATKCVLQIDLLPDER